tara:strand:- start:1609 stop:2823 length:1215 start_codon:yes stop_codon:yes gene_type:complete
MKKKIIKPCVVGLGYVGLPLFLKLQKKIDTIGYDNNKLRITELIAKKDRNNEFSKKNLILEKKSIFTYNKNFLKNCNFFIIAVPTPVLKNNKPDLTFLKKSCETIGKYLNKDDIVFFESTVYPGITENFCGKILQKESGLKLDADFFVGYSPERINPGDKKHSIDKIVKIVSANKVYALKIGKSIYQKVAKKIIINKNIKEAESAKVIENIQRDLNIGLMNEIYKVCLNSKINFSNVIKLSSTKWNFLKFNPGLVGGHCLPVDPYYYSYFAKVYGVSTEILLAGRRVNNSMFKFIFKKIKNDLHKKNLKLKRSKILMLGLSYKKNVSDLRNSYVIKLAELIKKNSLKLDIHDPLISSVKVKKLNLINKLKLDNYDIIINAVNHDIFRNKIAMIKKKKLNYIELF